MADKKRAVISLIVRPSERDMLKATAKKLNMSMSDLFRDALNLWLDHFRNCETAEEYDYWYNH